MSHILLSAQHGVNPGLENCFYCNEPKGVILFGAIGYGSKKHKMIQSAGLDIGRDGEAPNGLITDMEPCQKCQDYMKQGVILISTKEPQNEDDQRNPYRTGGWVVVRDDFIKRVVNPKQLADEILKKRVAFIPDEAWDMLGLPRGGKDADTG